MNIDRFGRNIFIRMAVAGFILLLLWVFGVVPYKP